MTLGYFAYRTHMSFLIVDDIRSQKDMEALEVENDRSTNKLLLNLVMHLTDSPRSYDRPKAVRIKDEPLGHPPLAFQALAISDVALVGSRSYRMHSALPI
jgi:hypothetical protein